MACRRVSMRCTSMEGQCDAPDFKSAGPHFNPEGKKHGLENPEGHHAGDMANFTVDAKGRPSSKRRTRT